jgi:excisionase family DNA binding protein
MTSSPEPLLTVSELGLWLGIAPKTLYRWAEQGEIPSLKVGGRLRFRPKVVERWLDEQQQEARPGHRVTSSTEGGIAPSSPPGEPSDGRARRGTFLGRAE